MAAPGVEQNSVILEDAIKKQKEKKGNLAVAFLDLAKAFDTVSHDLIAKGLERFSIPLQFRNVIADMYEGASTEFGTVDGTTAPIRLRRGVRQGDPLSPILFNICLDPLYCLLERDGSGWKCGSSDPITALGYADDAAILSDSAVGMQQNLTLVKGWCDRVGLQLNVSKSSVFHIISDGKTFTVNDCPRYQLGGLPLPWIRPEDTTRYLGKQFGPWAGLTVPGLSSQIDEWAKKIRAAPIRMLQRLDIWRDTVLPRLKARLLHSRVSYTALLSLDQRVRGHVKELLHLPEQVTNALLYAVVFVLFFLKPHLSFLVSLF